MRCFYAYFLCAQEIGERKPHNARRGFLTYKGEVFPWVAAVKFAATDKRQSELNLKPSPVGEGVGEADG